MGGVGHAGDIYSRRAPAPHRPTRREDRLNEGRNRGLAVRPGDPDDGEVMARVAIERRRHRCQYGAGVSDTGRKFEQLL